MDNTLIGIEGRIFEVYKYAFVHPGEGIRNVHLNNFHRKNVTDLFEKFHSSNDAYEIINRAMKNNLKYTDEGVCYVCPYFFKRRIPKYFYFLNENNLEENLNEIFKNIKTNFILRRNIDNIDNNLILTYKNHNSKIFENIIIKKIDNFWIYNGNIITEKYYKKEYIEDIIKILIKEKELN
jgi:hypothetical protein